MTLMNVNTIRDKFDYSHLDDIRLPALFSVYYTNNVNISFTRYFKGDSIIPY